MVKEAQRAAVTLGEDKSITNTAAYCSLLFIMATSASASTRPRDLVTKAKGERQPKDARELVG